MTTGNLVNDRYIGAFNLAKEAKKMYGMLIIT